MNTFLRLSKPIVLFWIGAGIFALEQIDDYVEETWPDNRPLAGSDD